MLEEKVWSWNCLINKLLLKGEVDRVEECFISRPETGKEFVYVFIMLVEDVRSNGLLLFLILELRFTVMVGKDEPSGTTVCLY